MHDSVALAQANMSLEPCSHMISDMAKQGLLSIYNLTAVKRAVIHQNMVKQVTTWILMCSIHAVTVPVLGTAEKDERHYNNNFPLSYYTP